MKYVDMHCDTITKLYKQSGNLSSNDMHIDINKLKKGECLLQNFAIFTNLANEDSNFTKASIDYYYSQLELNKDSIRPVYKYEDILNNENNGYINAMLTLEEGSVVDKDLNNLNWFYDKGVRMITLTWNYPNGIGYPNVDLSVEHNNDPTYDFNTKDGLTDFGIEYVKRCNELGIIIDVSHLSDKGFYDVCKYSDKPFVASHSNARCVCKAGRNLTDDMIKMLAQKGGVTGLNYCSAFIDNDDQNFTTIEGMVKHINHIVNIGGIDCVGLGSDFDGIENGLEIKDASGVQLLYKELKKYYSEDDIEKIFYKNVLRVYSKCLK